MEKKAHKTTIQNRTFFVPIFHSDFTGKERDEETGYGYFGARYMDHELLTGWLSVDPMADKYPSISPYAYCAWNPIKLVDPDGRLIDNYIIDIATGETTVESSDNNRITVVGNGVNDTYDFPSGDFYLNIEHTNNNGETSCTISAYGGTKNDNASLLLNYTIRENNQALQNPRTIDGITIPEYLSYTSPQGYGAGISGIFCGIIGVSFSIGIARDGSGEWGGFFSLNYATGVEVGIGISGFAIDSGKGVESIGGENQIISVSGGPASYSHNFTSSSNTWGLSYGFRAGLSTQLGWTWTF